jgi:hypothetical protein
MLRIMPPRRISTAARRQVGWPVAASDVAVATEIVVVIDVDVVSAPTSAPSPATTPKRSHRESEAERDG